MYLKNTAGQALGFEMVSLTTGLPVAGAGPTALRSIDGGAQAAATGTITDLGNGQYALVMTSADTNGSAISFLFRATGCLAVEKTILPFDGAPVGGAGSFGQVTYWTSAGIVSGDAGLTWDPTALGLVAQVPTAGFGVSGLVGAGVCSGSVGQDDGLGGYSAFGGHNTDGAGFQVFLCCTESGLGVQCAGYFNGGSQIVILCDGTNAIFYTPATPGNWASTPPTDLVVAVDRCAAALSALGHKP